MSYEPKKWVSGETITANGLNNLEEGIQEALDCCGGGGSEPLIFTANIEFDVACTGGVQDIYTYNLSWQEIYDALVSHRLVLETYINADESEDNAEVGLSMVTQAYHSNEGYYVLGANPEPYKFADANSLEYRTECTR